LPKLKLEGLGYLSLNELTALDAVNGSEKK